jgi:hypothetical protein
MRTLSLVRVLAASLLIIPLLAASPALAANRAGETRISLYAGQYAPQANVLEELDGAIQANMAAAPGFGGQLTHWASPNVGLAFTAFYSSSKLEGRIAESVDSIDSSVFLGSARLVVGVGGGDGPSILNFSAGLALNNTQYDDVIEGGTILNGVVGAELNLPLGGATSLNIGVDDYVYDRWFEIDGFESTAMRQHDLVIHGGLTFGLGG